MKLPLDSYSFRARFLPAVLVLAPVVAASAAWLPLESPAWKALASVGALAAAAVLLSHLARDMGKKKQDGLWKSWGGSPSTRFLRHRDTVLNAQTRQRYHVKLQTLIPGIELPSARSERAKPDAADAAYTSCGDWLREKTRNRARFPILFEENVGYGFRRNLWAMKPAGTMLAIVGGLAASARLVLEVRGQQSPSVETVAALAVSVPLLVWWLLRIRPAWVAQAADAYGKTLLAACEDLS